MHYQTKAIYKKWKFIMYYLLELQKLIIRLREISNEFVILRMLHTEKMMKHSVIYLSLNMEAQPFELTKMQEHANSWWRRETF